jgi:hypothetical protein
MRVGILEYNGTKERSVSVARASSPSRSTLAVAYESGVEHKGSIWI